MVNDAGSAEAILVAGHGAIEDGALVHLLGRIGETLLSTASEWRIRRLSSLAGARALADRASLQQHLTEIAAQPAGAMLVALAGCVTAVRGEPALITGDDHRTNPDGATLPLRWIGDCLRGARAQRVVLVASLRELPGVGLHAGGDDWLTALGTGRPDHLIAVDPSGPCGVALAALLDGLQGAAIDPRTGTITLRSLGDHLVQAAPNALFQISAGSQTVVTTAPIAASWDARLTQTGALRDGAGAPEDLVGTVLPGRFRIDRLLARGGFGAVYLARQLAVDRDVAVKVLDRRVTATSDVGKLFVQEIRCVGRIDHPNVVRIHQADITSGGRLFYAMELLSGSDLQRVIERDGVMPRDRALRLVLQLLDALAAAHDACLVHADVKPANTFVVPDKHGERLVLLDFGFARLRRPGEADELAGGTPAYMAPEQLQDGRVDHRSDLFAAALILVTLLTGWRRSSAHDLVPPLDAIADPALRRVLERALAIAPEQRYQTAGELAAALGGAAAAARLASAAPFRYLAPFTEEDGERLHGREREISTLLDHVLYRRAVIYTAPSGTGKTSLLRAGLIPHLDALHVRSVYVECRGTSVSELARGVWHEGADLVAAVTARLAAERRKLVLIFDQLEGWLADPAGQELMQQLAALVRMPPDRELAIVLSVREDFLASAMAHDGLHAGPVLRLGPLASSGARDAIVHPLLERRIAITDDLLAALLAELEAAAAALAPSLHWAGAARAVYPPHLQLACSVLYEALGPDEATLGLPHYERLGRLEAIVGEYLERVLEHELPAESIPAARSLLLALVHANQTRAFRAETTLVGGAAGAPQVSAILEVLRARGLVVRVRAPTGEVGWELVHDSLVPRVLAWIDARDLARRRAVELVRHRMRRSRGDRPSLLTADELRELREHGAAIAELDAEWERRGGALRPSRLIQLSRQALRRRNGWIAAVAIAAIAAFATAGGLVSRQLEPRVRDLVQLRAPELTQSETRTEPPREP